MGTKVTCPQMETGNPEMLCAYAALLLADGGVDVTADNINTVVSAAGGKVPAYYAALFENGERTVPRYRNGGEGQQGWLRWWWCPSCRWCPSCCRWSTCCCSKGGV